MKKYIYAIVLLFILVAVFIASFFDMSKKHIESIELVYKYAGKEVYKAIANESEINSIVSVLKGVRFREESILFGTPSCGFSTDISLIVQFGSSRITFCPACDGCPYLWIPDLECYIRISKRNIMILHRLLSEYGFAFPCV